MSREKEPLFSFVYKKDRSGWSLVLGAVLFLYFPFFRLSAEGIVVTGKREPIKSTKLSQEEISKIPGAFGEPLRAIETLPGVGITSFLLGEFSIRGASPNANNVYVDNLPVGYLFHTLGVHSVVQKGMIGNLALDTGVYSARYQNAIGGVIHIDTPDRQVKNEYLLEASFLSFSGSVTQVSEDFQDYVIASGRIATLNQTYGRIPELVAGNTFPDYGNSQLKAKKRLTPNHSFYFYTFFAKDTYGISLYRTSERGRGCKSDPGRWEFWIWKIFSNKRYSLGV